MSFLVNEFLLNDKLVNHHSVKLIFIANKIILNDKLVKYDSVKERCLCF